jgi:hypothetical protein
MGQKIKEPQAEGETNTSDAVGLERARSATVQGTSMNVEELWMNEVDCAAPTERTPRTGARIELDAIVGTLGADEIRVLARIALRLRAGSFAYGNLHVAFDARDFRHEEARAELEDALVYLACAWLKAESAP